MELEKQVVSLELAKRLKELKVPQESCFYWFHSIKSTFQLFSYKERIAAVDGNKLKADDYQTFSAFTVAELGELLPLRIGDKYNLFSCRRSDGLWSVWYENNFNNEVLGQNINDDSFIGSSLDTEADARAKMLIYLLEHKLLNDREQ